MDYIYIMQREMLRRGYSPKTITTYLFALHKFFTFCKKEVKSITKQDVTTFLDTLVDKNKSGNTLNVYVNAIKFFYEEILHRRLTLKIRYSKVPKTLPVFLTQEEVKKLFEVTINPKHKLILEMLYSTGLRVSELVHLKIGDLEFERSIGFVRKGKGNKDRPFIIAQKLVPILKTYIQTHHLEFNDYLFSGQRSKLYSTRSIQAIVKKSARLAGIKKKIHPHSLRHSYATHLIEYGYDVTTVQPLLGHASAETTLRYVHMANPKMISVKSPYDFL